MISLTASIPVAEIGKTPDISKTHGKTQAREDELNGIVPISSLWFPRPWLARILCKLSVRWFVIILILGIRDTWYHFKIIFKAELYTIGFQWWLIL